MKTTNVVFHSRQCDAGSYAQLAGLWDVPCQHTAICVIEIMQPNYAPWTFYFCADHMEQLTDLGLLNRDDWML